MRSALLAFLWKRLIPPGWLPKGGWRGWIACACWRESWKEKDKEEIVWTI